MYDAISLCKLKNSEIIFAKQNFNVPGYLYLKGEPISLWRKICSSEAEGYYEVIRSTDKVKLFFDVDRSLPAFFLPYISQTIQNVFGFTEKHVTLSCNRLHKDSYHIIYHNVIFENIRVLSFFVKHYLSAIHEIIDQNVYSKNRLFRCFKSKKSATIPPFLFAAHLSSEPESSSGIVFINSLISFVEGSNCVNLECTIDPNLSMWKSKSRYVCTTVLVHILVPSLENGCPPPVRSNWCSSTSTTVLVQFLKIRLSYFSTSTTVLVNSSETFSKLLFSSSFNETTHSSPSSNISSTSKTSELPSIVQRFIELHNYTYLRTSLFKNGVRSISIKGPCPQINRCHQNNNLFILFGDNIFVLKCHDLDHLSLNWDIDRV